MFYLILNTPLVLVKFLLNSLENTRDGICFWAMDFYEPSTSVTYG